MGSSFSSWGIGFPPVSRPLCVSYVGKLPGNSHKQLTQTFAFSSHVQPLWKMFRLQGMSESSIKYIFSTHFMGCDQYWKFVGNDSHMYKCIIFIVMKKMSRKRCFSSLNHTISNKQSAALDRNLTVSVLVTHFKVNTRVATTVFSSVVTTPTPLREASTDQEISCYCVGTKQLMSVRLVIGFFICSIIISIIIIIIFNFHHTDQNFNAFFPHRNAWWWYQAKFPCDDSSIIPDD